MTLAKATIYFACFSFEENENSWLLFCVCSVDFFFFFHDVTVIFSDICSIIIIAQVSSYNPEGIIICEQSAQFLLFSPKSESHAINGPTDELIFFFLLCCSGAEFVGKNEQICVEMLYKKAEN